MLSKYSPQIFQRQSERFPQYITQLESIQAELQGPGRILMGVILHGMRNEVGIVAMVLELERVKGPDIVPHEVI